MVLVYTKDDLGRFENRLKSLLKRHCPPPHRLGEFQMGLLTEEEAAPIAAHVELCPQCQDELVGLKRFLDDADGLDQESELQEVIVEWERPLVGSHPGLSSTGLRGSVTRARTFNAAHLWLAVTVQEGDDGRKHLLALVTRESGEQLEHGTAWLCRENQLIMGGRVDARGNVEIRDIEPGEYDLGIQCDGTRVWIRGVKV